MSTEEEPMQAEPTETVKEIATGGNDGNENFVVLDMAEESEESEKEEKSAKDMKDKSTKNNESDGGKKPASDITIKLETASLRPRKKPKAPVVDVSSLRKRKWQLKVYPLHAEDLQLNYMSILCKLASESLLYIPSEGRHGKAELYVATQKETATIIGKLLRMGFHHNLLSIEVVRKDTGGKEDGTESKKECKAFLMFEKFLSKKIFDAKGEKGTVIEKTVTLSKLPKAATKDFVGALFPFATEIEIIESDNPDERKATVKCKTPVTSLLVYKSFKRLEINDVHVKLSIDESVKAITLPPLFFVPPPEKDTGPPDSLESLNQSSLRRRPGMTPLNRQVMLIKKRALINRRKPTRGQFIRNQRPNQGFNDEMGEEMRPPMYRPLPRRDGSRFGSDNMQAPGSRDYPMGPGRRRMMERQNDRRTRERDSRDSHVTKEMIQLQDQLNQAIKNQIAMLKKTQPNENHMHHHNFPIPGTSHKAPLLGHAPRHFGGDIVSPSSSRGMDHHHQPDFGGASWTSGRDGRMDRQVRNDHNRADRIARPVVDRMDRGNRPDKRMDMNVHMDNPSGRIDRSSHDRGNNKGDVARQRGPRQSAFGGSSTTGAGRNKVVEKPSLNRSHGSERSSSNVRRAPEYSASDIGASQRNDRAYSSTSHGQASGGSNRFGEYNQAEGDNSYYRHY